MTVTAVIRDRTCSADSARWEVLLAVEDRRSGQEPDGLYGVLHGLRCCGAELRDRPSGGLRLLPGEISDDEYQRYRADDMEPHRAQLTVALSAAGEGTAA